MNNISERTLITKAIAGNSEAVGQLYDRYVKAIHRFFWYQLHDNSLAEDLTQDTFIEMIHSLHSFSGNGSLKNWLYSIAKRQLLHHLERKYKLPEEKLTDWLPDDANDLIDPDEEKQQRAKERTLHTLIATLSPEEQKLIKLVHLHGYTSKEAGKVTGKTPISIRVALSRALKKLRSKL